MVWKSPFFLSLWISFIYNFVLKYSTHYRRKSQKYVVCPFGPLGTISLPSLTATCQSIQHLRTPASHEEFHTPPWQIDIKICHYKFHGYKLTLQQHLSLFWCLTLSLSVKYFGYFLGFLPLYQGGTKQSHCNVEQQCSRTFTIDVRRNFDLQT